jgi:antibiotic biosynthesis monooxygenase (ABM) superfamily enzyme
MLQATRVNPHPERRSRASRRPALLNLTLGRAIQPWPFVLGSAVFNASMVALLTWVVMPLITRAFHGWLHEK